VNLLLDTSTLIWWATANVDLSNTARTAIAKETNTVFVSAASAWEIATKVRIGKLQSGHDLSDNIDHYCRSWGFLTLPITMVHARQAGSIPGVHKDPFDRMLAAQAMFDDLVIVTNDKQIENLGAKVLW
jgi:PIN domain nuclease of toxin-antitoxin system